MKKPAVVVLVFLAGLAPCAWADDNTAAMPALAADNAAVSPAPAAAPVFTGGFGPAYTIGPGDQLGIEVWKDPVLTRQVVVLPDGRIHFPLIGEIEAGGKTVAALKKEIEDRLARYVPDAVITVEVRQLNSMHIYVLGRVNAPGRIILTSNVNVLQALAIAGGPNPFANRSRIQIFRHAAGRYMSFNFDYDEVTAGKDPDSIIELRRGDIIFVP